MASQFYKRYVPPAKDKPPKVVAEEPALKRRRISEDLERKPVESSDQSKRKSSERRKKTKALKGDTNGAAHSEDGGEASEQLTSQSLEAKRHKKLKRKVEKAALASQKSNRVSDSPDGGKKPSLDATENEESEGLPTAVSETGLVPLPQPPAIEALNPSTLESLPIWLQEPTRVSVSSKRSLSDLLVPALSDALLKHGYENATPIQQGLLPMLRPGNGQYPGDICIASSTGTGKTLAFLAPMIEALCHRPVRRLRGLVIVPTREIVSQTQTLAHICATKTGLQISTATGTRTISEERRLLIRKTARYDKIRWDKTAGAKFDPIHYVSSDDDTSDREYKFMQGFEGYVPEYHSKADILICTPGRLVEHIQTTKGFTLDHVEWLVVDEMDRLLDQSFQAWTEVVLPALEHNPKALSIEKALQAGPAYIHQPRRVRKVLASATVTFDPDKLAAMHLWQPKLVSLQVDEADAKTSQFQIPPTLREVATPVQDVADKPLLLLHLLQNIFTHSESKGAHRTKPVSHSASSDEGDSSNESTSSSGSSTEPTSSSESSEGDDKPSPQTAQSSQQSGVLVFTSKNENAMRLTRLLSILDPQLQVGAFTGSSKSSDRRKTLAAFKHGEIRILIASNLASRSLNLTGLGYVINYDIPTSVEMYIHRVGRTARAGKAGTATTLLAHHESRWFWNEIARSDGIERQGKVERVNAPAISDEERQHYEQALEQLGQEVQGQ